MMLDERFERWDDDDNWHDPEDVYPEDDYDREYVNMNDEEEDYEELLYRIDVLKNKYDLTTVDREVLSILEDLIDLL